MSFVYDNKQRRANGKDTKKGTDLGKLRVYWIRSNSIYLVKYNLNFSEFQNIKNYKIKGGMMCLYNYKISKYKLH